MNELRLKSVLSVFVTVVLFNPRKSLINYGGTVFAVCLAALKPRAIVLIAPDRDVPMTYSILRNAVLSVTILTAPMVAEAATVTVGSGGFDDGWATTITYEDDNEVARRGTLNDRDNALNALGSSDGDFFELGFGSSADFTFGTVFDGSVSIFEITFGNAAGWPEEVDVYVGFAGAFQLADTFTNVAAQGGGDVPLAALVGGPFDTIRLVDQSPLSSSGQSDSVGNLGGFDIDAVRVSPVPIPAAVWLFASALGVFGYLGKQKVNA